MKKNFTFKNMLDDGLKNHPGLPLHYSVVWYRETKTLAVTPSQHPPFLLTPLLVWSKVKLLCQIDHCSQCLKYCSNFAPC